jgi:hypothetical protein
MILVINSIKVLKKVVETYNYVYFIILKNTIIFVRPPNKKSLVPPLRATMDGNKL